MEHRSPCCPFRVLPAFLRAVARPPLESVRQMTSSRSPSVHQNQPPSAKAVARCRAFLRDSLDGVARAGIFTPELKASDGKVPIPDGPGWGVEIDPDWLAAAAYQISELG